MRANTVKIEPFSMDNLDDYFDAFNAEIRN